MTLTLKTTDIIMANRTFATLDEETDNAVREEKNFMLVVCIIPLEQ